jgi:four helix bundle protein
LRKIVSLSKFTIMGNHWKDLLVWQKSHNLVKFIYKTLAGFPKDERFVLIDQIRRASISIPTNIVEGHSKSSGKEFIRYLYISRGSLEELRYLILLSHELGHISVNQYNIIENECKEISLMLNSLIKSIS